MRMIFIGSFGAVLGVLEGYYGGEMEVDFQSLVSDWVLKMDKPGLLTEDFVGTHDEAFKMVKRFHKDKL